nr:hypothetical protein [Brevundimonas sp.]
MARFWHGWHDFRPCWRPLGTVGCSSQLGFGAYRLHSSRVKRLGWTIFGLFAAVMVGGVGYAAGRSWSSKDGLGGLGGTFWSTLIGAVVGAAAAGIISFILAEIAASRTLNADRAKEKERRLTLAQTAMARVIRMHAGLNIIRSHIEESLMLANARNDLLLPRAAVIKSLANRFTPVEFSAEEQAVVRWLGDNKLRAVDNMLTHRGA